MELTHGRKQRLDIWVEYFKEQFIWTPANVVTPMTPTSSLWKASLDLPTEAEESICTVSFANISQKLTMQWVIYSAPQNALPNTEAETVNNDLALGFFDQLTGAPNESVNLATVAGSRNLQFSVHRCTLSLLKLLVKWRLRPLCLVICGIGMVGCESIQQSNLSPRYPPFLRLVWSWFLHRSCYWVQGLFGRVTLLLSFSTHRNLLYSTI